MAELHADLHMQLSCSEDEMDTSKAKHSASLKLANCHSKKSMYQDQSDQSRTPSEGADPKINASKQSLMHVGTGSSTHAEPKKELNESVRHGTSIFPFAAYVWDPQPCASRVPLHWHKELELVRFSNGVYEISVDMHNVVVNSDAFLLLPGNIMHTFTLPAHCQESAIVFDPNMLSFSAYDEVQSEIFEPLMSSNIPLPPIVTTDHPAFNRIDKLYRYCVRHGGTSNASERLLIKAKLLEILAIYHEYGLISRKEMHGQKLKSKQDKLKELLNYVDAHYAGPISIRDASLRLGVTDQYFCRYFRRVTGMSFTEYLNDLRLRRATKEIELTNRPISDIAFDHGFENAGYFFKNFKLKYGITPLRYRKKFLQENGHNSNAQNNYGAVFNPVDANHTSSIHGRDINTIMNVPASVDTHQDNFVSHGLVCADTYQCAKQECHAADTAANASAPSLAALANQGAISAQPNSNILNANSQEYSAKQSHAMNFGGDSAQHFDEEEFYDDEYYDYEISAAPAPNAQGMSAATAPTAPNAQVMSAAPAPTALNAQVMSAAPVPTVSIAQGMSAAPAPTAPNAQGISAAPAPTAPNAQGMNVTPAATSTNTHGMSTAALISSASSLNDAPMPSFGNNMGTASVPNRAQEIAAQLRNQDPQTYISPFPVASTDRDIKALLRTRKIKHLEASESEDELFDDDEHARIIYPNNAMAGKSANSDLNNSRMEYTTTGLYEIAPSNGRNVLSGAIKPSQTHSIKSTAVSETAPKKHIFVSALEEFQSGKMLRAAAKGKSSAKSNSKGILRTEQSKHLINAQLDEKHSNANDTMRDSTSADHEELESHSSAEILRRAHEQKLKTDAQYAAKQQQKQLKPATRAELRAKIAELEERHKNLDPFSI